MKTDAQTTASLSLGSFWLFVPKKKLLPSAPSLRTQNEFVLFVSFFLIVRESTR